MSSRARRISSAAGVTPFHWGDIEPPMPAESAYEPPVQTHAAHDAHFAALEREAFAKGFAQGELAGAEAAGQRGEMMLHRLTQTLEELTQVRAQMIHETERQMVQLALAIARRIVHREVTLDPDLLVAMARVAMERLGETAQVKVRLHPDDYGAAGAARVAQLAGSNVMILADAHLSRGGCRIESDMGILDAGVDAQLAEIARALLGDEEGTHRTLE
jgi:flagellar assembly protein FliH